MENTKDVYTQTISYEELMNEIYKLYVSNNDRMNLIIDTVISESGSEEYESNIYDKLDENDIEELNNTSELYILEYIENNLLYFPKVILILRLLQMLHIFYINLCMIME